MYDSIATVVDLIENNDGYTWIYVNGMFETETDTLDVFKLLSKIDGILKLRCYSSTEEFERIYSGMMNFLDIPPDTISPRVKTV